MPIIKKQYHVKTEMIRERPGVCLRQDTEVFTCPFCARSVLQNLRFLGHRVLFCHGVATSRETIEENDGPR